jgi:GT2 family glycosyltransferase
LIILDVGSLDGTREFLAGIGLAAQLRVEVVRTGSDLGISDAIDEALVRAQGEFVCVLNNDTVVSENWLTQMVNLAQLTPTIGIVGPMSNYAPAAQRVPKVPYRIGPKKTGPADWLVDTGAVDAFARQWREEHRGQWKAVERLGGFCLLIKREVLKRIGRLRDSSQLGQAKGVGQNTTSSCVAGVRMMQ